MHSSWRVVRVSGGEKKEVTMYAAAIDTEEWRRLVLHSMPWEDLKTQLDFPSGCGECKQKGVDCWARGKIIQNNYIIISPHTDPQVSIVGMKWGINCPDRRTGQAPDDDSTCRYFSPRATTQWNLANQQAIYWWHEVENQVVVTAASTPTVMCVDGENLLIFHRFFAIHLRISYLEDKIALLEPFLLFVVHISAPGVILNEGGGLNGVKG
ncbi:hypothetical protein EGR_01259 [Echinococcus granulosus]|uniref:Uncharacterized protein n=1 Tax=Echinococcus granulosus TaxID=6210 RepID=W6UU12_ECHGR|nr:hypothetical protein EGR_01259 [Echinococcus granulosus]EUB64131.1 hypothetical protein EGR_01259 [Echinococcus granulosus]